MTRPAAETDATAGSAALALSQRAVGIVDARTRRTDPFAGAGTTALVAKRHGRRFIGIDLNEEYVAMAQKRLGLTVDHPEHIRDDADAGLEDFA